MNEETQRIIARVILGTSILLMGTPFLLNLKKESKKENDEYLEEVQEPEIIEPEYHEPLKESYTLDEFNELVILEEAKIVNNHNEKVYYCNTHTTSNKNYDAMDGYELWQEYILKENLENKYLYAIDNYIYIPIKEKNLTLSR